MVCSTFYKQKYIYLSIHSFPNVIYCTENRPPNCHELYLTALTRYFSVHARKDFNDLTVLYIIIFVVTVDERPWMCCIALLILSVPKFPDQYTFGVFYCLNGIYSNYLEIFWKKLYSWLVCAPNDTLP